MPHAECHLSLSWQEYRLLPYERELGLREVKALLAPRSLRERPGTIELQTRRPSAARDLTYFAAFQNGRFGGATRQAVLEGTVGTERSTRRQATRYSVHGLHEYKGKFNPQTAKAILNVLELARSASVLDPFCGSGTTMIECFHNGYRGFGMDVNPLAIFIARAKLSAFQVNPTNLRKAILTVSRSIGRTGLSARDHSARAHYLKAWFPQRTYEAIERLRQSALRLDPALGGVVLALGSNLLRDYSLQEPADLRIRRRMSPLPDLPFGQAFLDAGFAFVSQLERLQSAFSVPCPQGDVIVGNSANLSPTSFGRTQLFEAAICSPPYATALPYIDTQRLSIVWLDLADPTELRRLETKLTGNREFSGRDRGVWNERLRNNADGLPGDVVEFCWMLHDALGPHDGFRRVAVPGLLYKYLVDMRATFRAVKRVLKPGAAFALVVGHNRTTLSGHRFEIPTPDLLAKIGVAESFHSAELTALQTYQRYGLHSRNAVGAEALLVLR